MQVTLDNGQVQDLSQLDLPALHDLQWEQERAFADRIRRSPRQSAQRAEAFRTGYDTVTKILACQERAARQNDPQAGVSQARAADGLVMGFNPRYVKLVVKLLRRAQARGAQRPRLFEIGYGSGAMLAEVAAAGFDVGGIEVSSYMQSQATARLPQHQSSLLLGEFLALDLRPWQGCHVIYWNDVLEHVHPDESLDFLRKAHELLALGGVLVTITPNWHTRPTDITKAYRPPRQEAEGFHLKEYTLREVTGLIRRAGFARVGTPLLVTPRHTLLAGRGLCRLKRWCEPLLEYLPFSLARLICRGGALNTTLAWKV
jgi:2-polyprenyl-3-methyl-5-hydroxy-6-metoxy-1,4-benzoquinol methylase